MQASRQTFLFPNIRITKKSKIWIIREFLPKFNLASQIFQSSIEFEGIDYNDSTQSVGRESFAIGRGERFVSN